MGAQLKLQLSGLAGELSLGPQTSLAEGHLVGKLLITLLLALPGKGQDVIGEGVSCMYNCFCPLGAWTTYHTVTFHSPHCTSGQTDSFLQAIRTGSSG